MALGSIQPLNKIQYQKIFVCKARPARKTGNLTAISQLIVQTVLASSSPVCHRDRFTFFFYLMK
jgi:hypothetical protein